GFLWTSNERDGTVSRVDRADRSIETVPVGRSPEGLAFADGYLWVAVGGEASIAVIDPRAGKVVARIRVGSGPIGLAARGHELWAGPGPGRARRGRSGPTRERSGQPSRAAGSRKSTHGLRACGGHRRSAASRPPSPLTGRTPGWPRSPHR